jgi:sugar lactone lactonase YvrE
MKTMSIPSGSTRTRSATRGRRLVRSLLMVLLVLGLSAPLAGPARADSPFPDRIELPDGFLPEGITIGNQPVAYLGSRADGDIFAADLRTGTGMVISQGPGTSSVGLKTDGHGLLYVAGGAAGNGRVVSIETGQILASYDFTSSPSFVNDVVLTKEYAWFTDSMQAQLYRVPLADHGEPAAPSDVVTVPLGGDWVQPAGFGANGLTETPDGRALLVVQSATGLLFRVDPATGVASQVDLGGALLSNGDGMLLRGRTLYVVQNQLNQVAVVQLDRTGTSGEVVDTVTSGDFDVPTTVAWFGPSLYLPNARFGVADPNSAEYWITRIPRP